MQVPVARRVGRPSFGEIGACLLLGFGVGTAAGFLLSEVFGTGGHRRMGRLFSRQPNRVAARNAALSRLRHALASVAALEGEPLEARPRGHRLELRGWVRSRGARSLAYRVARDAALPIELINHVLVRGEDDPARVEAAEDHPPPKEPARRPAESPRSA